MSLPADAARPAPTREPVRVAVTGATGWVGRAVCEVLTAAHGPSQILPFASAARMLRLSGGDELEVQPLEALSATGHDVLMHCAYVTREHLDRAGADAYIAMNAAITARVRDAIATIRPQAIFHASSGVAAAAGADLHADPYAVLKRLDEDTLRAAAADAGARAVTIRIFNLAGPWMAKRGFAMGSIVDQITAGGPVRLQATRPVRRAYTDVEDLAQVAVAACTVPGLEDDIRVDTGGEAIELGELARRATQALDRPDTPIQRSWDPLASPDEYIGARGGWDGLASRLGLPLRDLDAQVRRTALSPTPAPS